MKICKQTTSYSLLFFFFSSSLPQFFSAIFIAALPDAVHHPRDIEKHVCTPEEFTCKSSDGECIPMSWVCDGNSDCSNGSDETTCSECWWTNFLRRSVNLFWKCFFFFRFLVRWKSNSFWKILCFVSYADQTCRSDEFTCANGRCVQVGAYTLFKLLFTKNPFWIRSRFALIFINISISCFVFFFYFWFLVEIF